MATNRIMKKDQGLLRSKERASKVSETGFFVKGVKES